MIVSILAKLAYNKPAYNVLYVSLLEQSSIKAIGEAQHTVDYSVLSAYSCTCRPTSVNCYESIRLFTTRHLFVLSSYNIF